MQKTRLGILVTLTGLKPNTGKSILFFRKYIVGIFLIVVCIGTFAYIRIVGFSTTFVCENKEKLGKVAEKCIVIEKNDVSMQNDFEGTAKIKIQIPDYEKLFIEASEMQNPENYLLEALSSENYEEKEFIETVPVTVENGEMIIHSDEIVHQLLEKMLLQAIKSLFEVNR